MDEARGELPFPEHLYPEATPGTVLRVWRLDFPPEDIGGQNQFRLIETVDIRFAEAPSQDGNPVRAYDDRGRVFLTGLETRHPQPNTVIPSFFVPESIRTGGGSPEWVTPELAAYNRWVVVPRA